MRTREQYELLANLFRYPNEEYKENTLKCSTYLKGKYPTIYASFEPFFEFVEKTPIHEIEDVFSKTFHIQAICFLDLGYVLFAEDYKRGEFLVKMKAEQRKIDNDCGEELADNLPNVLTWMAKMDDEEFLEEFAIRVLIPSLSKMLEEFNTARMELKDKVRIKKQKVILMEDLANKNIFQYAINGLLNVAKEEYNEEKYHDPVIVPTLGGDFIKTCSTSCSTSHQPIK